MRNLALLISLGFLLWAPNSSAQSNPVVILPLPVRAGMATEMPTFSADRPTALLVASVHQHALTRTSDGVLQDLQTPQVILTPQHLPAAEGCGHLIIFEASPVVDEAMLLRTPREVDRSMPTVPAVPPCKQDLRSSMRPPSLTPRDHPRPYWFLPNDKKAGPQPSP
jgi:hypothetical protein